MQSSGSPGSNRFDRRFRMNTFDETEVQEISGKPKISLLSPEMHRLDSCHFATDIVSKKSQQTCVASVTRRWPSAQSLGDGETRNGQTLAVRESTDITGPNALYSSICREDL
jgi:hypothetical protein